MARARARTKAKTGVSRGLFSRRGILVYGGGLFLFCLLALGIYVIYLDAEV